MRAFNHAAVPRPPTPLFIFTGLAGPIDLEIGAGQGLHAIQYCQKNPERTLIAIERTKNRFGGLQGRSEAHPAIENLKIVRADAPAFVAHFVPDLSLGRVFLLYPSPYPKHAQANLRWHRSPFMPFLQQKLKPHGTLQLATNLEWYANEAAEWLTCKGMFKLLERRTVSSNESGRTHFERKYLARGESCFDLIFEKGLN